MSALTEIEMDAIVAGLSKKYPSLSTEAKVVALADALERMPAGVIAATRASGFSVVDHVIHHLDKSAGALAKVEAKRAAK